MVEQSVHSCELSTYAVFDECIPLAGDENAAYTLIMLQSIEREKVSDEEENQQGRKYFLFPTHY